MAVKMVQYPTAIESGTKCLSDVCAKMRGRQGRTPLLTN